MSNLCVNYLLHLLIPVPVLATSKYYPTTRTLQNFSELKVNKQIKYVILQNDNIYNIKNQNISIQLAVLIVIKVIALIFPT